MRTWLIAVLLPFVLNSSLIAQFNAQGATPKQKLPPSSCEINGKRYFPGRLVKDGFKLLPDTSEYPAEVTFDDGRVVKLTLSEHPRVPQTWLPRPYSFEVKLMPEHGIYTLLNVKPGNLCWPRQKPKKK